VIVRPGIVLGVGCSPMHGGFGHWASNLCCLGFGSGYHPLPLVLVQDVVQALVAASTIPAINGKSFNITGDVSLSAREFIAILATHSLRRHRYFPYTTVRRWEQIGKWALKLVGRKHANRFPWKRDVASMSCISKIDCAEAKRVLNWTPNSDLDRFVAEAIDSQLPVLSSLDLRLRSRLGRESC
jgi:nucleoside-diphosphate-sugar epimerase